MTEEGAAAMADEGWFDDFHPGQRFSTAAEFIGEAEITEFAARFDPQALHTDSARAAAGPYGGLIASGFHTLAASFALFVRAGIVAPHNLGSPGLEEVRWLKPLRPGDSIRQEIEVLDCRASQSRPDRGVVTMRHDTYNQRGELIMMATCLHMLARRPR
jgi:acyl dehydratase